MHRALLWLVPSLILIGSREIRAQADQPGSSDHRLFPRIAGYIIASYRDSDPVIETFRTGQGSERDTVEGRVTRFLYALPRATSQEPATQAGLVRHYELIVQRLGGTVMLRQPVYGWLHARLVREGREYWIRVEHENVREYNVVIAERSAPVQAAAAGVALATRGARLLAEAEARFALDTGWTVVVLPSRGARNSVATIRGLRVEDATQVRFGAYEARIALRGPSEIAVVVPEMPVGPAAVTVISAAGARTARDSFQVFQEPVEEASTDLRIYSCTNPRTTNAPVVTGFEPATVRTGDTLTIRGERLHLPLYVSFTYHVRREQLFGFDNNWTYEPSYFDRLASQGGTAGRRCHAAFPIEQSENAIRVVVPPGARTGPVALFGSDACVASEQSVGIRVGPRPR